MKYLSECVCLLLGSDTCSHIEISTENRVVGYAGDGGVRGGWGGELLFLECHWSSPGSRRWCSSEQSVL